MDELRPQYRSGKSRPSIEDAHCSWIVKRLYELMDLQAVSTKSVAERAGLDQSTIVNWRARRSPGFVNVEACFNALGYEIIVRKKGD